MVDENDIKDLVFEQERKSDYLLLTPGDDFIKEVRKTLGDYLSNLTKDQKRGNKFPLKAGSEEINLQDGNGDPTAINTGGNSAEKIFASTEENPQIERYSDSSLFDPTIQDYIIKGHDGHEVLKKIKGTGLNTAGELQVKNKEDNKILKKVSSILKNNRFHPEAGTPFVPRSTTGKEIDARPIGKVQKQFGSYDNGGGDIVFDNLRKVGLSLMLKATGEIGADGDPESAGTAASSVAVPGGAQLAVVRIDPNSMYASNAFAGDIFQKEDLLISDRDDVALKGSYGNLNSPLEPFGGFLPLGMTVLATALVVAVKLVVEGILLLLSPLDTNPSEDESAGNGPLTPGSYKQKIVSSDPLGGLISIPDFGIVSINNDFRKAVEKGIDVFFSFDGASFNRVLESPGFYAILVRSIIKSGNEIVASITDVASSGNFIEGAQAVLGIIDVIKSSKIISFVNVLASIGDKALELEKQGFDLENLPDKISISDNLPDSPMTRVGKSRSNNGIALAWRNSASPSMYILPNSVWLAASDLPNKQNKPAIALASLNPKFSDIGRISKEDVQEIETQLDAEYVPFYFHDLRTNEIISFHAMLSNIGDDYAPAYEITEPYGRVDPVMVYKNTRRNINLEFTAVATNESDFDQMWWKINKLTTMLYPQWSQGRKVVFDGDSFIQPFSQIPTSSPMIRLRLGDIFKTNYSRFALARLFGLGTDNFKLSADTISSADRKINIEASKIKKRMITDPTTIGNKEDGFQEGERAQLKPSTRKLGYKPVLSKLSFGSDEAKDLLLKSPAEVTIVKGPLINNVSKTPQTFYRIKLVDGEDFGKGHDGEYAVGFSDLIPMIDEINRIAQNRSLDEPTLSTLQTATQEFFSAEKNSIVKSFESVAGKGLAGFITNAQFNWIEGRWETGRYGARAPQWCKITLTFAPIHDIPPGLDADGFNRAPIYNVGGIVNKVAGEPYEKDTGEENFNKEAAKVTAGKTSNKKKFGLF